jgi:hypothetical protein
VALGLLAAPSLGGLGVGGAAVFAFLARHPARIWLFDRARGRTYPRTRTAGVLAIVYATCGAALLGMASLSGTSLWWPLVAAIPLAATQIAFDARNQSRAAIAEVSGAFAMGAPAASIGLLGGLPERVAWGLWLVVAMRDLGALFYARAQVQRARGLPVSPARVHAATVSALAVVGLAAVGRIVPWLSVLAVGLLAPWALVTMARPPVPARVVGWTQMAFGLLVTLLTATGLRWGL